MARRHPLIDVRAPFLVKEPWEHRCIHFSIMTALVCLS
jgi:hypothetical protein